LRRTSASLMFAAGVALDRLRDKTKREVERVDTEADRAAGAQFVEPRQHMFAHIQGLLKPYRAASSRLATIQHRVGPPGIASSTAEITWMSASTLSGTPVSRHSATSIASARR
jgi:hypothetical protein